MAFGILGAPGEGSLPNVRVPSFSQAEYGRARDQAQSLMAQIAEKTAKDVLASITAAQQQLGAVAGRVATPIVSSLESARSTLADLGTLVRNDASGNMAAAASVLESLGAPVPGSGATRTPTVGVVRSETPSPVGAGQPAQSPVPGPSFSPAPIGRASQVAVFGTFIQFFPDGTHKVVNAMPAALGGFPGVRYPLEVPAANGANQLVLATVQQCQQSPSEQVLFWAIYYGATLRGMWWWWGPPIVVLILLFMARFWIAQGLDRYTNPRLRRAG